MRRALLLIPITAVVTSPSLMACTSVTQRFAANAIASSGSGTAYASDDDPELVRAAVPFGLKTMEGLLVDQPQHVALLTSASRGFTQYAYAFVQQDADAAELQGKSSVAREIRARAGKLYLRARDYGLRALDARHEGLAARLGSMRDLDAALADTDKDDVPLLYWTAASWALAIASAKDRIDLVAQLPAPAAVMRRALALDESFDRGAIHEFFVSFDAAAGAAGGGIEKAKEHFRRALELSNGKRLGLFVTYAEAIDVPAQDRADFTRLLTQVATADAEAISPEDRLANIIAQRRARLLLAHAEDLFL